MKSAKKDVKTSQHATRYFFVGVGVTAFNYALYAVIANLLIKNNDLLWLSNLIATVTTVIVAYIAHSKITWKERNVTKASIIRFFIWNAMLAIIISPSLTQFFSLFTPLYEFAYSITSAIHLPFTYEFVLTTGAFALTSIVIMILNFLFYDKFVFQKDTSIKFETYTPKPQKSKVSVIVPIYNSEKYLKDCLDSIIKQSHKNLEIILVDDGSTDQSGKIADEYSKKDSRIKVIHQKNQGQSAARNAGLKKTTGQYICFIDSDDEIKPNYISELLSPYQNKDNSLSVCGFRRNFLHTKKHELLYTNPSSPRKKSDTDKTYILRLLSIDGRLYSVNNKLFISKITKSLSFDESINFAEDLKFILEYLSHTNYIITFIGKPLYIYNFGSEHSTIIKSATIWQNWQTSYQNLSTWLGEKPTPKEKLFLRIVHLRWRISYLRSKTRAKKAH